MTGPCPEAAKRSEWLIDEVSVEPDGNQLHFTLKGNLAGMLRLAQQNTGRRRSTTS
jgi:hypothetical protein